MNNKELDTIYTKAIFEINDVLKKALEESLTTHSAHLVERIESKRVEKHDDVIEEPVGDTHDDFDWCGRDISAMEAKMYNLGLDQAIDIVKDKSDKQETVDALNAITPKGHIFGAEVYISDNLKD